MILFLIIMTLWVIGGTATYRRLGALEIKRHKEAVEAKKKPVHSRSCVSIKYPYSQGDRCSCDAYSPVKLHLGSTRFVSYTVWPGYVAGYAIANLSRFHANLRGEDWSFFVEPKMVQTKSERIAELENSIKALEAANEMESVNDK